MNTLNPSCSTCAHVHEDANQPNPECRLNPPAVTILLVPQPPSLAGRGPTLTPSVLAAYPPVNEGKWCGQWKARIVLQ